MSVMRTLKLLAVAVVFCSTPMMAQDRPGSGLLNQVVSKVAAREKQEMAMVRQHTPLV